MQIPDEIYEVPSYTKPDTYWVKSGAFERGEITKHSISVQSDPTLPENKISFKVRDDYSILIVEVNEPDITARELWTIVHYCRDYGVPGVCKERVNLNNGEVLRLGALYCIGPFELSERETNYLKYGEKPYEPDVDD